MSHMSHMMPVQTVCSMLCEAGDILVIGDPKSALEGILGPSRPMVLQGWIT